MWRITWASGPTGHQRLTSCSWRSCFSYPFSSARRIISEHSGSFLRFCTRRRGHGVRVGEGVGAESGQGTWPGQAQMSARAARFVERAKVSILTGQTGVWANIAERRAGTQARSKLGEREWMQKQPHNQLNRAQTTRLAAIQEAGGLLDPIGNAHPLGYGSADEDLYSRQYPMIDWLGISASTMSPDQNAMASADPGEKGLECRRCGCRYFRVLYTRAAMGRRIFRRRECRHCGRRTTTYETAL